MLNVNVNVNVSENVNVNVMFCYGMLCYDTLMLM